MGGRLKLLSSLLPVRCTNSGHFLDWQLFVPLTIVILYVWSGKRPLSVNMWVFRGVAFPSLSKSSICVLFLFAPSVVTAPIAASLVTYDTVIELSVILVKWISEGLSCGEALLVRLVKLLSR